MNKQDKEKAEKLAKEYGIDFPEAHASAYPLCYKAALEMAAWKQEQMIQWLDENASSYVSIYWEIGGYATPEYDTEKMIKDFKQAMEGE